MKGYLEDCDVEKRGCWVGSGLIGWWLEFRLVWSGVGELLLHELPSGSLELRVASPAG
jgi:hypothetical protein